MKKFKILWLLTLVLFLIFNETLQEPPVNERIVGGVPANINDYPFMAGIVIVKIAFQCGCAIISPDWVITAAHCIELLEIQNVSKHMAYISTGSSAWAQGTMHAVVDWVHHSKYDNVTFDNDIALIRVKVPFKATLEKAIPIAKESYKYEAGKSITVIGWGVTKSGSEFNAKSLNKVNVNIIRQTDCVEMYYKLNVPAEVTNNMFCAGVKTGGKDACQFDSGGPIFDDDLLIGIVSWGEDCAIKDQPGVYTRVTRYRKWITETTKRLNAPFDIDNVKNVMSRRRSKTAGISSSNIAIGWAHGTIVFILCLFAVQ